MIIVHYDATGFETGRETYGCGCGHIDDLQFPIVHVVGVHFPADVPLRCSACLRLLATLNPSSVPVGSVAANGGISLSACGSDGDAPEEGTPETPPPPLAAVEPAAVEPLAEPGRQSVG
jgi:hypothetical protein